MSDYLKLSQQLCFPIYHLSKEITNAYRPMLEQLDVTYPQYLVLMVLWEHGTLSVKQIGEQLHLDSGTLTPLLKRLQAKEMVERERAFQDERIVEISLTEKGNNLKQKATCIPLQLMEQVQLSTEEQSQLKTILDKILNNLQK